MDHVNPSSPHELERTIDRVERNAAAIRADVDRRYDMPAHIVAKRLREAATLEAYAARLRARLPRSPSYCPHCGHSLRGVQHD